MAKPSKANTQYVCSDCGTSSPRWLGRCPGCEAWNTLVEELTARSTSSTKARSSSVKDRPRASRIADVSHDDAERIPTGIGEIDRVLGGGIVAGGVTLLGGDPGIGKSTLLMQALAGIAESGRTALYVTGEESAAQVALRARRLPGKSVNDVHVLATTDLDDVFRSLADLKPRVAVIDSVQTVRSHELESAAGSVAQLRAVSASLIEIAKRDGIALFLIGHVTKEGALAGPKVLEHLVDTVLAFEGDAAHAFRIVRATKNRFGSAQEIGVFEMMQDGLREVPDPSTLFLAERTAGSAGSIVVAAAEGSRALLIELQALVAPAVYGSARRVVSGIDANRLAILLAVLDRKAGMHVLDRDVFVSAAGGARIEERAVDLALVLAAVSSFRERPLPSDLVVFGELGLAAEVRGVPRAATRVAEARKMGFRTVILPRSNAERFTRGEGEGVTLVPVESLARALDEAGLS